MTEQKTNRYDLQAQFVPAAAGAALDKPTRRQQLARQAAEIANVPTAHKPWARTAHAEAWMDNN